MFLEFTKSPGEYVDDDEIYNPNNANEYSVFGETSADATIQVYIHTYSYLQCACMISLYQCIRHI